MKEFSAQQGGRYTYIDDIVNLQDLSLAFSSIFSGCGNFIVSGCTVEGSVVSSGFVYINDKLRYFSGAVVSKFPTNIYELNSVDTITYADSKDKIGRKIYSCAIGESVPTANDIITGAVPGFISIDANGKAYRLNDAFFGKYALLINSPYPSQTVQGKVSYESLISFLNGININGGITLQRGDVKLSASYDDAGLLSISNIADGHSAFKITIGKDGECSVYFGDKKTFSISSASIITFDSLKTSTVEAGSLKINAQNLYNNTSASDDGSLDINVSGYNGSTQYFRNTNIGDGKGNIILSVNGKNKKALLNGCIDISFDKEGLSFVNPASAKEDVSISLFTSYKDKNSAIIGQLGYLGADKNFTIKNSIGNIVIPNDVYINALYIGGKDISSIYVNQTSYNKTLKTLALSDDVYSKKDSDAKYVTLKGGLTDIVNAHGKLAAGQLYCRNEIGALGTEEVSGIACIKKQYLADVVAEGLNTSSPTYSTDLENRKKQICSNIGAAYAPETQGKLKDTGWIPLITGLYIRQIGNIVTIQGKTTLAVSPAEGVGLFNIPNYIDAPTQLCYYEYSRFERLDKVRGMKMAIDANKRQCYVVENSLDGNTIYINLTYMV